MYKKRRRVVRRRPVVRRRGRGIVDRVKQAAKYAVPIAAAVAANRLGSMAFKSSLGQRAASTMGNYALGKAKSYIARELARM
jgi:hypothetical protein